MIGHTISAVLIKPTVPCTILLCTSLSMCKKDHGALKMSLNRIVQLIPTNEDHVHVLTTPTIQLLVMSPFRFGRLGAEVKIFKSPSQEIRLPCPELLLSVYFGIELKQRIVTSTPEPNTANECSVV